jgi:hypothetical protein
MRLQERTMAHILPRLRKWKDWAPVHKSIPAEVRRLKAENGPIWPPLVDELRARIAEALRTYPLQRVAIACEVRESLVLVWSLGHVLNKNQDDVLRALGALRYLDLWPIAPSGQTTNTESA